MKWTHFLGAIFAGRVIRFGALAALTIKFGPDIVTLFRTAIRKHPLEALAVVLGIVAIVLVVHKLRRVPAVEAVQ
jgi:threonine/homoserine/homoserine lactone efflux protein